MTEETVDPNEETAEDETAPIAPETSNELTPDEASEDELPEEGEDTDDGTRRSRLGRFARRLIDRKEIAADTRDLLGSVLATSDKAKTEAIRMAANEVRSYLEAMELKEDVKALLTSYSLEISISLKPLAGALKAVDEATSAPEPESE